MEYKSTFALDTKHEPKVQALVDEGNKKYSLIENIICESEYDAGPFYEHEIDSSVREN